MVADKASASSQEPPASQRVAFFDVVRGFSVISMVLFHLCYDLRYIYGFDLGFFQPPFQDIWRCSISWVFLFIAGCMCTFSRNGLKRSAKYLLAALTVYVVTVLAAVDTPISFGIIFCMGACTLVEYLLQRLHIAPSGLATAATLLLAFLFTQGISHGYVGFGSMHVYLPKSLYATPYLSCLRVLVTGVSYGAGKVVDNLKTNWGWFFVLPIAIVLLVELFFVIKNIIALTSEKQRVALAGDKEKMMADLEAQKEAMRAQILAELKAQEEAEKNKVVSSESDEKE